MSSLFQWLMTLQEWKWLPVGRSLHLAMGHWMPYVYRNVCQEPGRNQFSVKKYSSPPHPSYCPNVYIYTAQLGVNNNTTVLLSTLLTNGALWIAQPVLEFKLKHHVPIHPEFPVEKMVFVGGWHSAIVLLTPVHIPQWVALVLGSTHWPPAWIEMEPHEPKCTARWCRYEFSASTEEEGARSLEKEFPKLHVFFFLTEKIILLCLAFFFFLTHFSRRTDSCLPASILTASCLTYFHDESYQRR